MRKNKPKIPNVWWRNGWAWGRIKHRGHLIRKSLETQDPRVARSRVHAWIKELKATEWGENPRRTFNDAAERFMDEHLPRLKGGILGRTAQGYLSALERLAPFLDGMKLDDIKSAKLSEFEQARRLEGVTSGTIRGDLFVLSSMFSRAEEWEYISGNPVAAYIRGRAKAGLLLPQPDRTRYFSHDEEAELLTRCRGTKMLRDLGQRGDHIMLAAGITLSVDIGLRHGELLRGTWPMIDLDSCEWTVPAGLAKSGRARTIPILPRSQAILRVLPRSKTTQHVLWHSERGEDKPYGDLLPALLAIASGGRWRITRRELDKLVAKGIEVTDAERARIAELAEKHAWADEIPDVIWHDLRRTCGCRLLQDYKMPIERVSKWLGHSSVEITQKAYAFLEVRHLHEAVGTALELPLPMGGSQKVAHW